MAKFIFILFYFPTCFVDKIFLFIYRFDLILIESKVKTFRFVNGIDLLVRSFLNFNILGLSLILCKLFV